MLLKRLSNYALILLLFAAAGCARQEEPVYIRSGIFLSAQASIAVYTTDTEAAKKLADAVFAEWKRLSDEFSFSEPYTFLNFVNKQAVNDWVKVDDEFLYLLNSATAYKELTEGAYDATFATLWPIWKEAASTGKLPLKEEITVALANTGSGNIQVDYSQKRVRFTKPIKLNFGGILRAYCLVRARSIQKESGLDKYPVVFRFGGSMLACGKKDWVYEVPDPTRPDRILGRLKFREGIVMASSGRDRFVQIGGKTFPYLLDARTGYPIDNFSNLMVYYPDINDDARIPSSVLAVMGKEKAFGVIGTISGATAVWVDGTGSPEVYVSSSSQAGWEKDKTLF